MNILKFIYKNKNEGCTKKAMDYAAQYGHLECLKFLHSIGKDCTTYAMDYAAANGHLECIQFLHSIGKDCTENVIDLAMENGHLDIVKWLRENINEYYIRKINLFIKIVIKIFIFESVYFLFFLIIISKI